MANFGLINQFGSLTINGKTLKFEDFDKNKDGKISSQEYQDLLKEVKLDTIEFSTVDTNKDDTLSAEEFATWEQKIAMQEAVNNMAGKISKDFTGKTQYLTEVKNQLKAFIEEFEANYKGEPSKMAEAFEAALPAKYEEIKTAILANDPTTIKSKVLDETYSNLTRSESLEPNIAKRITNELEKEADKFIKTYTGTNLEADLKAHLEEFMNTSEASLMSGAVADFKNGTAGLGPVYDSNDLLVIKEYAKDFLRSAINEGVTIRLGNVTIKSEAALTKALAQYTDGESLLNAINDAINSLNTCTRKEAIIAEEKAKATEAAEKAFTDIKGSEYAVDSSLIDWSKVDSRYFDGGDIYYKTKNNARGKAYDEGYQILTGDLKNQIKAQIEAMLKEKGIPFDKIAQVFENVYNQTAQDTLNADGMITGKHKTWFRKAKANIDVKTLCDTFITNFNANIAKVIDEMNVSNTDMDTMDLDYTAAGKDDNGNPLVDPATGEDLSKLYATGKTITVKGKGADYYESLAIQMIDNMKTQMLAKAKAMCEANGIEFDNTVFDTMFNNAKLAAVNVAVTGRGHRHSKGAIAGSAAGTAATGTVAGAAAATVAGWSSAGVAGLSSTLLGVSVASSAVPVIGWAAAGVSLVAAALTTIFGIGKKSVSSLNTRTLMDTFTQQFKENYTLWVENEKAQTKAA